jgi:uncharacterized protein (TIGR03437 family)
LTLAAASFGWATTAGGPVLRTGIPVDAQGATCTACHNTYRLNDDPRGFVRIQAAPYRPGVKQTVRVTVNHPEGMKWGFQLTARRASDLTLAAGAFDVTPQVRVRCANNTDKPAEGCGTQTEFAGHNANSTAPGTMGGRMWEVEWTPPANDIGEVAFYAVGNAANNGTGNQGDRIYTTNVIVPNANGCTGLTAKPTVRGVGNGASFGPELALNSLMTIVGAGFYPGTEKRTLQGGDLTNDGGILKFPTRLNCVAVEVGGERAPVFYAEGGQINAQVPTGANGRVPVTVIINPGSSNEQKSDPMMVNVGGAAPAFFTFNGTVVAAAAQDGTLINGSRGARPGELIQIFATGLGASNPVWQAGEVPTGAAPVAGVTVRLGANLL